MSKTSDGTFTHVRGELAWTIAEHRTPSEAIAMTEHLTDADHDRFELLGLVNDCALALYWDYLWHRVVPVEFDAHGVYNLTGGMPKRLRYDGRGQYLRVAKLDAWDWVHPRHQWLMGSRT